MFAPMHRFLLLILVALCAVQAPLHADDKSDWDILDRKSAPPPQRRAAAKSIAERAKQGGTCEKIVQPMLAIALAADTYPEVKLGILEALKKCDCDGVQKLVAKKIGQGNAAERSWLLQLAGALPGPEIDRAVLDKGLTDEKPENRVDAAAVLAQHKAPEARAAFEAILRARKDTALLGPIVMQLAKILDGSADWANFEDQMLGYVTDKNDDVRRAALAAIAKGRNPARLDLFTEQLSSPDWSTRAIALDYLEKSRTRQGLGAILAQLANEPGGTRLNAEIVSALIRLTGMNFADRAADWAEWWKNNRETFEFPTPSPGPRTGGPARQENETRVVQFYGIEVESKRVCFVVDISGSMQEAMKEGDDAGMSRLELAKRELGKIVDGLDPGTLFNIITFSSDVDSWLDSVEDLPKGIGGKKPEDKHAPATGGVSAPAEKPKDAAQVAKEAEAQKKFDEALRAKAHKYVEKLAANGGTNIHDALEMAFADPKVDTIFFLTDGQPSFGREVDPVRIREIVKRWNETRHIKISAISIGEDMDLLKWLAQDSGGEHRHFK